MSHDHSHKVGNYNRSFAIDESLDNDFLQSLQEHLHDKFGIEHSTIQIETSEQDNKCNLEKPKCV